MHAVTAKIILQQLKADLIGKDSYRGITLTYAWLANQFSHFSLGFIPTLLVHYLLKRFMDLNSPLTAAISVSLLWLLFEVYNFLGPLLSNRKSISRRTFFPGAKYQFNPRWGNVAFDTVTDVCFFCLGAFTGSIFLNLSHPSTLIAGIILGILLIPCHYWYSTKLYIQASQCPFQFRLSQWSLSISKEDKDKVFQFMSGHTKREHLLIFGAIGSGKTSMAVGLATETSIRHQPCMYTTAMKLYSMFAGSEPPVSSELPWTWRTCSLLVIDDINPGMSRDLVTPQTFLSLVDAHNSVKNRADLCNKRVIWILGGEKTNKAPQHNWQKMLVDIGVDEKDIFTITLSAKK